jgi:hypothetical protein
MTQEKETKTRVEGLHCWKACIANRGHGLVDIISDVVLLGGLEKSLLRH